jgi:hypothetical protein
MGLHTRETIENYIAVANKSSGEFLFSIGGSPLLEYPLTGKAGANENRHHDDAERLPRYQ